MNKYACYFYYYFKIRNVCQDYFPPIFNNPKSSIKLLGRVCNLPLQFLSLCPLNQSTIGPENIYPKPAIFAYSTLQWTPTTFPILKDYCNTVKKFGGGGVHIGECRGHVQVPYFENIQQYQPVGLVVCSTGKQLGEGLNPRQPLHFFLINLSSYF